MGDAAAYSEIIIHCIELSLTVASRFMWVSILGTLEEEICGRGLPAPHVKI